MIAEFLVNAVDFVTNRVTKLLERNKKGKYIWMGPGENPFKDEEPVE